MRLIDADKLLDALCDGCTGIPCEGNRHGSMEECQSVRIMRDVIHEQPTAYDVDRVCEEIDKHSIDNTDWGYSANPRLASYYLSITQEVIDIVRGGVND